MKKVVSLVLILAIVVVSAFGQAGASGTTLVSGQTVRGSLQRGDSTLQSGKYFDTYYYISRGNEAVVIDCTSTQFDTYLGLQSPTGVFSEDDDGSGSRNARLSVTLEAGRSTIIVTSYAAAETGAYELTIRPGSAATAQTSTTQINTTQTSQSSTETPIIVGQTVRGRLQPGDRTINVGEYCDSYSYISNGNESIIIDCTSNEFDTWLMLILPSGDDRQADGGGSGTNARLVAPLDSGTYSIWVTSSEVGETGSYELVVHSQPTVVLDPDRSAAFITPGINIAGGLDTGDPIGDYGFYERYSYEAQTGESVIIDCSSTNFDTMLFVVTSTGAYFAENDDIDYEAGNLNSRLSLVFPMAGRYDIIVTTYRPGTTGDYNLILRSNGIQGGTISPGQKSGL